MSFQLFGFDFIPADNLAGFWVGSVKFWRNELRRDLLSVYCMDGEWLVDLFYVRVIGRSL